MKIIFENVKQKINVRKNLIEMKALLKGDAQKETLRRLLLEDERVLLDLLEDEEPKIRKNAALILGELGDDKYIPILWDAYEDEMQLFVKSAYITALGGCECEDYLDKFKARLEELTTQNTPLPDMKHVNDEIKELQALILKCECPKKHKFRGLHIPADVILLTNRDYKDVTVGQITTGKVSVLGAGVRVQDADVESLLKIRTYSELLFSLECSKELKPETAVDELMKSNLIELMESLHEGEAPFYFRIECKSKMPLEKRSFFTKKLAGEIERKSKRKLINSTSFYEFEIRLIENKNGNFYPLLKLFTVPDRRFAYRRCFLPTSIQPVKAALCMALAKDYLKEGAQILDPFCGVGTMLLERNYLVNADPIYGIDILENAIIGARENALVANVPAHFVNRDFFTFSHEYLFDEIVTNMPTKSATRTGHDVDFIYSKLFDKAGEVLKPGGIMILYSHDKSFVKKQLREHKEMTLKQEWCINAKEEAYLYAIQV